jgi:3-oxoadipate enol-lactonase
MPYMATRLGRWFYEERGAAKRTGDPAIVLLNGLLFDGGMWSGQVEALSALGRVLAIDGPGHGKSELPPPFTLEDHGDALADALVSMGIGRAIVIGHSWGGMVALRLAIRHAKLVQAIAAVDSSAAAEDRTNVIKYRAFVTFARRFGLPQWFVERQLARILFGPRSLAEQPGLIPAFTRRVNGYSRDGLARAAKAVVIYRKTIVPDLARITTPTLVVCGREDAATPPAKSEELVRGIRGAKVEWVEAAGHMTPIERPAVVAEILAKFVREHLGA